MSCESLSPVLMEVEQAAQFLGWTVPALRSRVQRREVPYVRVGRRVFFEPTQLREWIRPMLAASVASGASQHPRQPVETATPGLLGGASAGRNASGATNERTPFYIVPASARSEMGGPAVSSRRSRRVRACATAPRSRIPALGLRTHWTAELQGWMWSVQRGTRRRGSRFLRRTGSRRIRSRL
jgi:excisionase family DNA binding protein